MPFGCASWSARTCQRFSFAGAGSLEFARNIKIAKEKAAPKPQRSKLTMNPKEWNQVESAFAEGLKLPVAERQAFWQNQFGADPRLKAELELLIRGEQQAAAKGFLDKAAWSLVSRRTMPLGESSSMIGKLIKHYEILRSIGSGGMGDVYLAKDRKLGREVALKIVQEKEAKKNPNIVIRFLDEMRILSKIEHDNVARLYDSGTDDEQRPFIVMEYLRGFNSLRDSLSQAVWRGLPLDQIKIITRQFCTGLAQAHDQGIVHRDIKPENIMLINDRDGLRVKVIDFGVAIGPAFTPEELAQGVMTHQASTFSPGTAVYKSPEQLENWPREQIKATSDVYASALVIYEMLTGRRAYPSSEHRIHDKEFPSASSLRPELGAKIDLVLRRALSKQPRDRQPDIRTLADEVIAALPDMAELANRSTASLDPMPLESTEQETRLRNATEEMETIAARHKPNVAAFSPITRASESAAVADSTQSPAGRNRRHWLIGGTGLILILLAILSWKSWRQQPESSAEPAATSASDLPATIVSSAPNVTPQPNVSPASDGASSSATNESGNAAQQMKLAVYRNNDASPVAPDVVWRSGNSVKFNLRFDRDGFLYVLNHGSDGQLQALYPHHSVNRGDNRVVANQSIAMPPTGSTPSGGFRLDQQPGVETFYIIFAPTELNGDELLTPIQSAIRELGAKPQFAALNLAKLGDWFAQLRSKAELLERNSSSMQQTDNSLLVKGSGILVKTIQVRHER